MTLGNRPFAVLAQAAAAVATSVVISISSPGCATRAEPEMSVTLQADTAVPPRPLRQVLPAIPDELRGRRCSSGTTVLEVEVGRSGRVQRSRVTRTSGEPVFDDACVRSAAGWEFAPATRGGKAVVGTSRIECHLQCP